VSVGVCVAIALERPPSTQLFPRRDTLLHNTRMQLEFLMGKVAERDNQQEKKHRQQHKALGCARNNAVVPRENGQFVQSSNQVPPRGDVARYEDAEGEDGERVH